MTDLRTAAQQALEALYEETAWFGPTPKGAAAITTLRAALAQQAEPGEPVALKHRHEWFGTGGMEPGQFRCIHCGVWGQEQSDPQIEDRLARHGIPMPEAPTCPDCHGIGYDASGQTCACQENPSF